MYNFDQYQHLKHEVEVRSGQTVSSDCSELKLLLSMDAAFHGIEFGSFPSWIHPACPPPNGVKIIRASGRAAGRRQLQAGPDQSQFCDDHRVSEAAPSSDIPQLTSPVIMNSLRVARAALRVRPTALRAPLQRRTYADAAPDKASTHSLPGRPCASAN